LIIGPLRVESEPGHFTGVSFLLIRSILHGLTLKPSDIKKRGRCGLAYVVGEKVKSHRALIKGLINVRPTSQVYDFNFLLVPMMQNCFTVRTKAEEMWVDGVA
jgi:hypothetical protein